MTDNGVLGSSVPRKEDRRLLTGRGRYVSDLVLPGMLHAAFVRSPYAHAMVTGVDASAALAVPGVVAVVTGDDPSVVGVRITARSELPGYVETSQPLLAWPKVRFAGEAVAVVVAADRTVAADAAELVEVSYEPLPVVVDAVAAIDGTIGAGRGGRPGDGGRGAVVHDAAPDNVYLRRRFEAGDPEGALAASHLVVERAYRTNRHAGVPIEGRAAVASWDDSDRALTLWSGTQIPHLARHALAVLLGMGEHRIRVVAPDVGGGFGVKASLYPEEVALCLLARRLRRPVKWVEQRSEHMVAAHHARDHAYRVTAGFEADGRLTALVADAVCNAGAYSVYPWTAGLEPLMAGGLLAGPYRVEHYRCDVTGVATNTAPAGPYRGVARPATVYVMDRLLDTAAARLGLDPVEIRRVNLITPEEIPYRAATRLVHDSRTYGTCLDAVLKRLDYQGFRAEQVAARADGRLLGVGLSVYNELTGLGRGASAGPRMSFRTGHEVVTVRLDPLGGVTVLTGASSQGQGIETTFAQIAADTLGVGYDDVEVRLGDTAAGGFGFGAFSSRQGVIGGGAVLRATEAVREKVLRIAAHLLEAAPSDLTIEDGEVRAVDAPSRSVTVATVARVAYLESQRLPDGEEPGLEATRSYDPLRGTFAAGAQAAVVEVDPETGAVALQRFVCVEDAGRVYHPVIVEGQMAGAVAQGIAGALFEHHVYDDDGQLLTASLADYLMPSAAEFPSLELDHLEDPAE
ncbi:MAG TPA: xanthine dehydrogenase family protein molybdopterin-binding subunit, partial [Acidimicrobiia bacterium]|nr:xanthine dehydrogenase family protein molybdopterin-binding subunit [Acidimicrobiia bacterium]